MKIVWLGSVINSEAQLKNNAISLASSYWQGCFIEAIESTGIETTTISSMPYRAFPFGPMLVRPIINDFVNTEFILYDYLNLKWFRERSKSRGIKKSLSSLSHIDAIVSYNPYPECRDAAAKFSLQHQVPWIEICADAIESKPGWEISYGEEKVPDGFIFLSSEAYERCPVDNKMLTPGGVPVRPDSGHKDRTDRPHDTQSDSVVFLFSGSFEYWSGLSLLLQAFIELTIHQACSLFICGYGPLSESDRVLIENDPRIHFFGTVSKPDLDDLREKADILVNPRPCITENVFNFPSKLLEYMAYQKIIVSTKTPGIPSDFSEMMILTTDSVSDLGRGLQQAAEMTAEQRKPILHSLGVYAGAHTWSHEADRFGLFLRQLIKEA